MSIESTNGRPPLESSLAASVRCAPGSHSAIRNAPELQRCRSRRQWCQRAECPIRIAVVVQERLDLILRGSFFRIRGRHRRIKRIHARANLDAQRPAILGPREASTRAVPASAKPSSSAPPRRTRLRLRSASLVARSRVKVGREPHLARREAGRSDIRSSRKCPILRFVGCGLFPTSNYPPPTSTFAGRRNDIRFVVTRLQIVNHRPRHSARPGRPQRSHRPRKSPPDFRSSAAACPVASISYA